MTQYETLSLTLLATIMHGISLSLLNQNPELLTPEQKLKHSTDLRHYTEGVNALLDSVLEATRPPSVEEGA
jgi:hypothetical protein